MKKDLLEKELQKEIKKFKWKRRVLKLQIFFHRQKLNMVQFFAIPESSILRAKYRIEALRNDTKNLEKDVKEEVFYRMYLRED